jgi:hypothetical protein
LTLSGLAQRRSICEVNATMRRQSASVAGRRALDARYKWYSLAISRYSASEEQQRAKAVEKRDLVAARMTPAQIAEAQKLAREWKPRASAIPPTPHGGTKFYL